MVKPNAAIFQHGIFPLFIPFICIYNLPDLIGCPCLQYLFIKILNNSENDISHKLN